MSIYRPVVQARRGHQVHVSDFPAPLKPCAAHAALPGQARSHINFGPVMPGASPGPLCLLNANLLWCCNFPGNP